MTMLTDDDDSKERATSDTSVDDNKWHHIVGMRKGSKIYIYVDGDKEDSEGLKNGTDYDLSGTSQHAALIGAIWDHDDGDNPFVDKFWDGLIDEVRVYDYAVDDPEELLYLSLAVSGQTGRLYAPLISPANLYNEEDKGKKYINFKDYEFIAEQWLVELLFPAP